MPKYTCSVEDQNKRLDVIVSRKEPEFTRSRVKQLIKDELITVNRESCKPGYKVRQNDVIEINVDPTEDSSQEVSLVPENLPIDLIYEDCHMMVVNKSRGMVVHPAPGHQTGTLVNALLYRSSSLSSGSDPTRPGIVHRLDKDTSGIMMVAKTDYAHEKLTELIQAKTVERNYLALVIGEFPDDKATIDLPIGRDPLNRKKMTVISSGKTARTKLNVLKRFKYNETTISLIKLSLETGRTHQIRVHMAYLGYPILADPVYGGKSSHVKYISEKLQGQALHSFSLELTHPIYKREIKFRAALADDILAVIKKLAGITR